MWRYEHTHSIACRYDVQTLPINFSIWFRWATVITLCRHFRKRPQNNFVVPVSVEMSFHSSSSSSSKSHLRPNTLFMRTCRAWTLDPSNFYEHTIYCCAHHIAQSGSSIYMQKYEEPSSPVTYITAKQTQFVLDLKYLLGGHIKSALLFADARWRFWWYYSLGLRLWDNFINNQPCALSLKSLCLDEPRTPRSSRTHHTILLSLLDKW